MKGTCRTQVILSAVSLTAILTLAIRPLVSANFSDNLMSMFVVQIVSVPALVHHMELLAADSLASLQAHELLQKSLTLLEQEQSIKIIANSMQGTQSLALLANLVHLFYLEPAAKTAELGFPKFNVSAGFVCVYLWSYELYCPQSLSACDSSKTSPTPSAPKAEPSRNGTSYSAGSRRHRTRRKTRICP